MLVYDSIEIPERFDLVSHALSRNDGELRVWASAAYQRGEEMSVGPSPAVSATIELEVGDAVEGNQGTAIPMTWIAASATRLFPRMEAEIVASPLGVSRSLLEFRGRYQPPLDGVGRFLDRAAFHHVAEATVRGFLERLADAVSVEARTAGDRPPSAEKL